MTDDWQRTVVRRTVLRSGAAALAAVCGARAVAAPRGAFVNSIVVEDNRIWIAARIGSSVPYFFAVDTGAEYSLIDVRIAVALGLKPTGLTQLTGVGGVAKAVWFKAPSVELASGVRFANMLFASAGGMQGVGRDAAGLFGSGLFTTYDSDLDFDHGKWRVYTQGRGDFDGLHQIPAHFMDSMGGRQIMADATIDGFAGRFTLDTGTPVEVSLDSAASHRSGLWKSEQPYAPIRSGGIGRLTVRSRVVRMKRLKLGPFVYERPLVTISEGAGYDIKGDGLIGLPTLQRLNLSTNVQDKTLWASPSMQAPVPTAYPRSGLLLTMTNGRRSIEDVGIGSPGAATGLAAGDVVIDASPALIDRLETGAVGDTVSMTIERGAVRRSVLLTLADYL